MSTLQSERVGLFAELDTSRSLGNFASLCDIPINIPQSRNPLLALQDVKSQLNAMAATTKTFGILNMLDDPQFRHRNSRIFLNDLGRTSYSDPQSGESPNSDVVRVEHHDIRGLSGRDVLDEPKYRFDSLMPGASYLVRMHFVEQHANHVDDRYFDICINETVVERRFDILKAQAANSRL